MIKRHDPKQKQVFYNEAYLNEKIKLIEIASSDVILI